MRKGIFVLILVGISSPLCGQQSVPINIAEGMSIANNVRFVGVEGYTWSTQSSNSPYSLHIVDRAYRFELHPSDHWQHDIEESAPNKNRTEIAGGILCPIASHTRISYEVKLEQADLSAPNSSHILGQRHGTKDKDDVGKEPPVIAFTIVSGGIPMLYVNGSAEQPLVHVHRSIAAWTGTAADFAINQWHTVVIEANTDPTATDGAYVDLWLDGKWRKAEGAPHTYSGQLGYVNEIGDYWKFGDYAPYGITGNVVVWFRNIHRIE